MDDNRIRVFTPTRMVALALIAIVAGGLTYLRVDAGSAPVSVPAGAKAGDLTLRPCRYATEDGSYRPIAERSSCPRIGPTRGPG